MNRPTALTLAVCMTSLFPLQTVYADSALPQPATSTTVGITPTLPTPPPVSSTPLQGGVIVQPATLNEETASGLIQVTHSPIPLASKLQKSYEAYRIIVQSDYPSLIKLQSGAVNNAQSGNMAFELTRSGMTPVYCTMLLGLAGFVLIGVPMLIVKNGHNEKTRREALKYTNQIPLIELTKGETLHFDTLITLGQKPDVSLVFKDPHSGLLFSKHAL